MRSSERSMPLEGHAIVVTGAARGLGQAFVKHAATHGAAVVANDVDSELLDEVVRRLASSGGRVLAHPGDISDPREATDLVDRCVTEFGHVSGLINNAGRFHVVHPLDDSSSAVLELLRVNLLGTFNCGLRAFTHMAEAGRGSIVNVTSGAQSGMSRVAAYGATKGGITSATLSWAIDGGPLGIRVNAISPLATTRMTSMRKDPRRPASGHAQPATIAPLATYLLSDESIGISGRVFRMSGTRLSLVAPPRTDGPVLESASSWSYGELAAAMDKLLADRDR